MRKINFVHCDPKALGAKCEVCPLYKHGKHLSIPTPDEIRPNARLAVLTESPGGKEEVIGSPLVGPAGRLVERTLTATGSGRDRVSIVSTLLCRPPKNFSPTEWKQALEACRPRLDASLRLAAPRLILALGAKSLLVTTGKAKITPWYGAPLETKEYGQVFPVISPGLVLRTPALNPVFKNWVGRAVLLAEGKLDVWKWPRLVTEGNHKEALTELFKAEVLAVDIENVPSTGRIRCIGIGSSSLAVSVPLPPEGNASAPALSLLRLLLASPIAKVLHNASFDIKELKEHGWVIGGEIHDTLLLHAVTDPRLSHRLTDVAAFETHAPRWKTEHRIEGDDKGSNLQWFETSTLEELLPYNAKDVNMTAVLYDILRTKLATVPRGAEQYQTYRELNDLAMRMTAHGVQVDPSKFQIHEKHFKTVLGEIRVKFRELGIPEFNEKDGSGFTLGKNGQHPSLNKLFFQTFKCNPVTWSEKTNAPSLDETAINRYCQDERKLVATVARLVKAFRKNAKLLITYVEKLPLDEAKIVHPQWRVFGTRTGRWSAKKPGIQTIPKEKKKEGTPSLRDLFCVAPGKYMAEADYKQLEVRIAAELSQDPLLLEWFAAGLDVYTMTAREIWGTKEIDKRQRHMAKTLVLASNYGGGAEVVHRRVVLEYPDVKIGDIQKICDLRARKHLTLTEWQDRLVKRAEKDGFVEAPISGKRQYYYDGKIIPTEVLNYPIQATAGDIANLAILWVDRQLDWATEAILMQVHDAIILEGPDKARLIRLLKEGMEQPIMINGRPTVFPVDLSAGTNWDTLVKQEDLG